MIKQGKDFIPNTVLFVIKQMEQQGYECYLVGGCVRDLLRNQQPHDWDLTTSALPQQVMACFPDQRVIPTGLQHGTVTLIMEHIPLEITTYRREGNYSDRRHPDQVTFSSSLQEDLQRRDFTINAMAYHPEKGLVDPFGGQIDLQQQQIRCVGAAELRFQEDALRMLRALRFASVFSFHIEGETAECIHKFSAMLSAIAPERIWSELCRLFDGKAASITLIEFYDVWEAILGCAGILLQKNYILWQDFMIALQKIPQIPAKLATLLLPVAHQLGLPQAQKGLAFFRLDKQCYRQADALLQIYPLSIGANKIEMKQSLLRYDLPIVEMVLVMEQALTKLPERKKELYSINQMLQEIVERQECYLIEHLAVNGNDMIEYGLSPGKQIGDILHDLLQKVIYQEIPNTKAALLKQISKL